jgi:toxoflavin synthase
MTTDYDPIAEDYQRARRHPWREHVETFTLSGLFPDLAGKAVIDIACGEGHFTRWLRERGAARVVGVDLSPRMIELARAQEAKQRLGIDYRVGHGRTLAFDAEFDIAFAAYFLNYAHDRRELQEMCDSLSRVLKPGGRFITVNTNPKIAWDTSRAYRPYGFEADVALPLTEGAPIVWRLFLDDGSTVEIENYHLNAATHEAAFRAAGFSKIIWHEAKVSPEGRASFPPGFWDTLLQHPTIAFIECVK